MQPLKLVIEGEYFDSHLYQNRLLLFRWDGSLVAYDWQQVLDLWKPDPHDQLVITCAFFRSNLLYTAEAQALLRDHDVLDLVRRKFSSLAQRELTLSQRELQPALIDEQQSPLPFPYATLEVYMGVAYTASSDGIHAATTHRSLKHTLSTRPKRLWQDACSAVTGSYGSLAVSGGDAGLWEIPLAYGEKPRQISELPTISNDWNFHSIFASAGVGGGYLASFSKEKDDGEVLRTPDQVYRTGEIFGVDAFSWGSHDKLSAYKDGCLLVQRYNPFDSEGPLFVELGALRTEDAFGQIVAAATASFGVVLEFERGLTIIESDGTTLAIPGEPVNWKVFPRSRYYANQLHIIRDQALEIMSFNQDYLVDQRAKVAGYAVGVRLGANA